MTRATLTLLTLDWRQSGRNGLNCVGYLFIRYLLKLEASIIPPTFKWEILKYYPEWALHNAHYLHRLTDEKYLLLCHLLSFLSDVSKLARYVEQGQDQLAQVFCYILGVDHPYALHLIKWHQNILSLPYQDGDQNSFSFDTPFPERPLAPLLAHLRFAK